MSATIETLAHRLRREQPSFIRLNYGMQRHHGGGMAVRTIACMPAVIGSWRASRWRGAALDRRHLRLRHGHDSIRPTSRRPARASINMNQLAEALAGELPGPTVEALYVYNSNPAAVAPNQAKVLKGLNRDDLFVVVHELFATDTVDYADLVLPATSQLEQVDIHGSYGHHDVMLNHAGDRPARRVPVQQRRLSGARPRLGFEPELFPDDETLIREVLTAARLSKGSRSSGCESQGLAPARTSRRIHSVRRRESFPRHPGKCELYSERMQGRRLRPTADLHAAP